MQSLNNEQREAILHLSTPLLVLAGAGSGKTKAITNKIAHLIQTCEYNPRHVLAVTFTNKAAREMKHRVEKLLDKKNTKGLNISTFHTWGLNFIRREYKTLEFKKNFSIYDAEDSLQLLASLSATNLTHQELQAQQQIISAWKNKGLAPDKVIQMVTTDQELTCAKLYLHYQQQLKSYNAVDFDDLILQPLFALQAHPSLREKWQTYIRYLLVDEYQDTNIAQYELIRTLVGVSNGLTVVGDDHQSIYAWRGADIENLKRLQQDYPTLKIIKLEQNYRSTGNILNVANHLISHNETIFEKNLWSVYGPGEPIRILSAETDQDEAQLVASEINRQRFQEGARFWDFAILYRSNHQAQVLEKTLREMQIPYELTGGTSFFSRSEVKDIIAYLKLLTNPDDDGAFLRVANVPKREIGPKTLEKLSEYAKHRQLSLFAASYELGLEQFIQGKSLTSLRHFCDWINLIADNANRGETYAVLTDMLTQMNYEGWLYDHSNTPKGAEKRWENVLDLMKWLKKMLSPEKDEEALTLEKAVQRIMLVDMLDRQSKEEQSDCVQLLTMHAAKGLEFKHVYIIGLEEDILPHRTSIEEDAIEEERRLAYVGFTRAKVTLTLTYASQRKRARNIVATKPSRFLSECPTELIEWPEKAPPSTGEARQALGRKNFGAIKAMLGQKK